MNWWKRCKEIFSWTLLTPQAPQISNSPFRINCITEDCNSHLNEWIRDMGTLIWILKSIIFIFCVIPFIVILRRRHIWPIWPTPNPSNYLIRGRYKKIEFIGSGTYGKVYLVDDKQLNLPDEQS